MSIERSSSVRIRRVSLVGLFGLASLLVGCHTDMWVQPKSLPLTKSEQFRDGNASRPLVPGTVARGNAKLDDALNTGFVNKKLVTEIPLEVNKELILRGKERFEIFCTHCHGALGDGKGMITKRGLVLARKPASYHTDRLRKMPIGHFFDVISNGYGTMYSQAPRIEVKDRWAIAAYVRTLQYSQNAPAADLAPDDLAEMQKAIQNPPAKPDSPADPDTRNRDSRVTE